MRFGYTDPNTGRTYYHDDPEDMAALRELRGASNQSGGLEETPNYGTFQQQVESGQRGMADVVPGGANNRQPLQINPEDPRAYLQGLANARLMRELGFRDVPSLYKMIYGRDPDPEGLSFYQDAFGPTIELEELDRFIGGAQGADRPSSETAEEYFRRTGDEAGAQRIRDFAASNDALTRDLLSLYRPELADPFSQLSRYGNPQLIDQFFPGMVPPIVDQAGPGGGGYGPGGGGQTGRQPGGVFGVLPGSVIPMSGTDMQRALASYDPASMGAKIAAGYRQVLGRDIDPAGARYWLERFGNQDLSQAAINRYLLGGASGEDKAGSKAYEMSLTGGRPSPDDAQYFQPIYSPEYRDYMPARPAQQQSYFGPGFNPFDYTGTPNILQSPGFGNQTFNPPGGAQQPPPTLDLGSTPPNPFNIPPPQASGPLSGPRPEPISKGIAESPVSPFVEQVLGMRGLTAISTPSGGLDFVPAATFAQPSTASGGSD